MEPDRANSQAIPLPRAYYSATIRDFILADTDSILGRLTSYSELSVDKTQSDAWEHEVQILRQALRGISGHLLLEYNIPRMGRRVDAIVISGAVIFVIEFKVGEDSFRRHDLNQVWDYALDLKNFHERSHEFPILPILVATEALANPVSLSRCHPDLVYEPISTSASGLYSLLLQGLAIPGTRIDPLSWLAGSYLPTPTIVEAAQSLYAKHSVEAISRSDAGAKNLKETTVRLEQIVDESRAQCKKSICFVTGVPGAGKTLVGLNLATKRSAHESPTHAVFLSGNGPLVAVLREALTRDEVERRRTAGEKVRKGRVGESVKAFIQNVHHFRDEALREDHPPIDHVVIFDEAQRAWNLEQTAHFMRTRKKRPGFSQSEPQFLISYLDRHQDWAVIVCLVGGGQEINTGEAGIAAWLEAVEKNFPGWSVYISPELHDHEYAAQPALNAISATNPPNFDRSLHLGVSMRSFRAENASAFVKALIDCETQGAQAALASLRSRYPVAMTRSLQSAKSWIRHQARGSERFGLVASSQAQRLKPHAIDVRVPIDPIHWFLNDREDTRSSFYLEDAATEFQVQGLELDWVCVTWDGDFRYNDGAWGYHSFCGSTWRNILKETRRNYLRNAYRVLLTRARQGMIIFIPTGDDDDPTRRTGFYDGTYRYLSSIGIPEI